ncbi:hypothetical protein [uncultured Methanolobus sp.]|uniref:hypothetical protein n=1 Tax=uncultured Methanolobus sp. TaxID=218300 RepID=UPI0029C7E6B1|nr:hypothetical protein [uncultured Methanolobus sp.]
MLELEQNEEVFIETVLIDDEEILRREGTIEEINAKAREDKKIPSPVEYAAEIPDISMIVSKVSWEIIKASAPVLDTNDDALHIFSQKDSNWENYVNSKKGVSKKIQWKIDNRLGINCFNVSFRVIVYYGAKNPNVNGKWIPLTNISFGDCYSRTPWKIEGKASITPPINVGTIAEPVPFCTLSINLIATKSFISKRMESYDFYISGNQGVERAVDDEDEDEEILEQ